ncbi:MAG TPA: DegT/DnrJ/EryC1/StrS family aminotransferase [Steroidobacteraceae bacterium]|nr:DegT/DnrJ/EryC1/StrS family aminotransferase [Steroidobacteraceae bacterium]
MKHEVLVKAQLEEAFKKQFECDNVCMVSNGTHAIEVLLTAMDLPRGAKVLVPELSFLATATAVARCGLIPVFADVSRDYMGLTLDSLKAIHLNQPLSAVIVVHLAGFINRELQAIAQYCRDNHLPLIEDCAQIHDGYYKGVRAGNLGDAATFSFQSSKLFNSGEGGAIISRNSALILQCKAIINWGWPGENMAAQLDIPSSNYRLSYLQCERLISEFSLADSKVAALRKFYGEIAQMATQLEKTFLPASFNGDYIDCPFFFMVTACQPLHQLEPRSQYPMSRSTVVLAILRKWFPDLVAPYREANHASSNNINSSHIVGHYAFLRISQFTDIGSIESELQKL